MTLTLVAKPLFCGSSCDVSDTLTVVRVPPVNVRRSELVTRLSSVLVHRPNLIQELADLRRARESTLQPRVVAIATTQQLYPFRRRCI